ncbi:MAG: hypothetical protein AAEJ04_05395 [Planctomycetota bacterium]
MTKIKLLLLFFFLASVPVISAGCSAGNTYVRAIGSWKTAPATVEAPTQLTCGTKPEPLAWMKNMAHRIQERITSDLQVTIDSTGAYVVQIHGREISGQIEVTSIFGDGLGISTEMGSLKKEARVRMIDDDHMLLNSAGTEITLVRCP